MAITIDYTTICDGCGLVVTKHIPWDQKSMDSSHGYMDIWSPGWPDDWLQNSGKNLPMPMLFHSSQCYKDWLVKNGRGSEAYENAVWTA